MADPIILFNNSTGSDTAASGAGPSTALFGTAASFASTVVTLDGSPDLTGVATDGSHVLWLATSTGRQWFTITAKDNTAKTVTVHTAPAGTTTGLTWGLGGKRAGLDATSSRRLWTDWVSTWKAEIQYTGTNYVITSTSISGGAGYLYASGGRVVLEQQANTSHFNGNFRFFGFHFINTNVTKTSANCVGYKDFSDVYCTDCWFGSTVSGERVNSAATRASGSEQRNLYFINCRFIDTIGPANISGNLNFQCLMLGCDVYSCGSAGSIICGDNGPVSLTVIGCRIYDGTGIGIAFSGNSDGVLIVEDTTIHNQSSHGVSFGSGTNGPKITVRNNLITKNGGYGLVSGATNQFFNWSAIHGNTFGSGSNANTSGATSGWTLDATNTTADPQYVDAANGDLTPTNTTLKGTVYPTNFNGVYDFQYPGAIQPDATGGGGGAFIQSPF